MLRDLRWLGNPVVVLVELLPIGALLLDRVQRSVVRDAVEPRPEDERPRIVADADERLHQRVLDDLFGAVRVEPATAVGLERGAVTVDDRVEGSFVAGAGKPDEVVVRKSA